MSAAHGKSWTKGEEDNVEKSIEHEPNMMEPANRRGNGESKRIPIGKNAKRSCSHPVPATGRLMSDNFRR